MVPPSALTRPLIDRIAGGWTLDAAEHICNDHDSAGAGVSSGLNRPDVLDLLGQLIDKSLVLAEPATDGSIRYRLLEQLRQFLAAHLDAQAGAAAVRSGMTRKAAYP